MHRLGDSLARLRAICCIALFALPSVVHADHGFTKGNWPFRPLERPAVPADAGAGWSVNTIDQFIAFALGNRGLVPNKSADKATLLRRVTFDLIGLPPTPEEVEAFLA